MSKLPSTLAVVALAVGLVFFSLARPVRAEIQSDSEITEILTKGCWIPDPQKPSHVMIFSGDGTCTFGSIYAVGSHLYHGSWQIGADRVTVTFGLLNSTDILYKPINPSGTRTVDNKGATFYMSRSTDIVPASLAPKKPGAAPPGVPAAEAIQTPALLVTPDIQESASQVVQTYHNSLVFVNGDKGAGSGFIAAIAGANYLITNAHVTAEIPNAQFKTLDGGVVQGGTPSVAIGEDIFCMAMPAGGKPFEIMKDVDTNAAIGDAVVVLGNADGGGVVNTIIGRIVGIGPNLVEIDAPFVPGNSGSPIVHLKSGKVIGVATYVLTNQYDLTTDRQLKEPVVRRFGYRLDSAKGWQAVKWPAFNAQAAHMDSIKTLTDDLADFFRDLAENKGVVTPGRHTNPVIATRIDDWVAARSHNPSPEDIAEADADFLSFLKIACQTDITAAQPQITYDYFRRELADQKQERDAMAKGFKQIIQAVGQ